MAVTLRVKNIDALTERMALGYTKARIRMRVIVRGPAAGYACYPRSCYHVGMGLYNSSIDHRSLARFLGYIRKGPTVNDCWSWAASVKNGGYGQFIYKGHNWAASRFSYLVYVKDPGGNFVLHKCDNPPCCNPAHLFLGDHQANTDDMMAKGRNPSLHNTDWGSWATGKNHWSTRYPERVQKGEQCGRAKLTAEEVLYIRRVSAKGRTRISLARRFNVSDRLICAIVKRKLWRHI